MQDVFLRLGFGLIILSLFSSCGSEAPDGEAIKTVDYGQFKIYVDRFEQRSREVDTETKVDNLTIKFGDLSQVNEGKTFGLCEKSLGTTPTITIDKVHWKKLNGRRKEALIMHELGHCVLNRPHRDDVEENRPASVMSTYLIDAEEYDENYRQYMEELFST